MIDHYHSFLEVLSFLPHYLSLSAYSVTHRLLTVNDLLPLEPAYNFFSSG